MGADPRADLAAMLQSLAAQRQFGSEIARPHQLALVAEVMTRAGNLPAAQRVVDEALEHVARAQDRYYESELHRLKGDLLRRAGDDSQAVKSFKTAIAIARQHGARLFEMRAAANLAAF